MKRRFFVPIHGAVGLVEIPNNKQIPMPKIPNNKPVYDFEERAYGLDHLYFEFEICLKFDAWNLGFQGFRERVRFFLFIRHQASSIVPPQAI